MPLARYVNALLKKDMKTEKLREFCVDQLDVFLGKGVLFSSSSIEMLTFFGRDAQLCG